MANLVRDGVKERFWRRVLARQAKSRLSVRAFCRREKLSEPSFYAWRRTIAQRDTEAKRSRPPQRPAFLPVLVSDRSPHESSITIEVAGGLMLRLPESISAQRLAELVQALEVADRPHHGEFTTANLRSATWRAGGRP